MANYYDILQVARNAKQEELKAAYKRLAILYHPDKNNGNTEAEENFKRINEAYKTLSNAAKRRKYDIQQGIVNSPAVHYRYHEGGLYTSITNNYASRHHVRPPKPEVFRSKRRDVDFYLFWLTLAMIFILVATLIFKLKSSS